MLTLEQLLREDGIKMHGSGNELDFLCPFHEDKTPSARVNIEKNLYFCHGCGAKGNSVSYLKEARNMTGREAKEYIEGKSLSPVQTRANPPKVYPSLPKQNFAGARKIADHHYPDEKGKLIFAVCRYESFTEEQKNKAKARGSPYRKCDMWTPEGNGWIGKGPPGDYKRPLWRLKRLLDAPKDQQVWLVEGEKCVESAEKAFPQAIVTTWAGGTGAVQKADFSPLFGRRLVLLSDADKPGRKAMKEVSSLLWEHCPKIRIVIPPGESGNDIHDWIEKGGAELASARIKKLVRDAPKPKPKKENLKIIETDELFDNRYYRVVGNIQDQVAILLSTHRILTFSRETISRSQSLVAIADFQWWLTFLKADSLTSGICLQVGSSLIRQADRIGQIDTRAMMGRGFFKAEDGRYIWHLGNRLHVDGKDVDLGDLPGFLPVSGPPIRIKSEPATEAERKRLAAAILKCRWVAPYDGMRFMGWLVSAIIGGALPWRPHAWMKGLSKSGKSWILEQVAKPICGDFFLLVDDPTVAGVSRIVRSDSVPVAFDEAEPNRQQIESILDILRSSSGGTGLRVRAQIGTTTGVDMFQPRFSAILSSINMADMNEANASRFITINLSREKRDDWPEVEAEIQESLQEPGRFLAALVRDGAAIAERAAECTRKYVREGVGYRQGAIEGTLTAAWEWWSGQSVWMTSATAPVDEDTLDDGERMLLDLMLGFRIRIPGDPDTTLARILLQGDDKDVALDYGVRIIGDILHIHPSHKGVVSGLQKKPEWSNVNVKKTLLSIPGSSMRGDPLSFRGTRRRTVQIPRLVCDKLGLEIFSDQEEMSLL